jgi:hypothetical protein
MKEWYKVRKYELSGQKARDKKRAKENRLVF